MMKVAFVKDFLPLMRGAEKVLEQFCELYPEADIFSLFYNKGALSPTIERHRITTSFIQHLPQVQKYYRHYLPLYPLAVEQFDLSGYDLVISMSQAVAKGARARTDALHLCYCFTPMRYVWDMYHEYFPTREMGLLKRIFVPQMAHYLRRWDVTSTARVNQFVAISTVVAERIKRWYHHDADIIFPPCDDEFYTLGAEPREGFYLVASALAPYKRIDLAIEAFKRLQRPLVIIGTGQDEKKLNRLGKGSPRIRFLGWQSNEVLRDHYRRCRALIFPGEEDFGIVPVEAQLCGTPVIAYGKGGALDTISEGETGIFFREQTTEALCQAVLDFERRRFYPEVIRQQAVRFGKARFKREMKRYIENQLRLKQFNAPQRESKVLTAKESR